jgi:type IV pilus assembly protein PilE
MNIPAMSARPRASGFTLIELMIVVGIIAILAAIAVPIYGSYVMRGKIIDATSKLSDTRMQLEKFFMDNRTYLDAANAGQCYAKTILTDAATGYNNDPARYFNFSWPTCTATAYTLQADGIAARGMNNFTFQLDQTNAKLTVKVPAALGWAGTGNTCWVIKNDGSC